MQIPWKSNAIQCKPCANPMHINRNPMQLLCTSDEMQCDSNLKVAAEIRRLRNTKHVFFVIWSQPPRHYTFLYTSYVEGQPRLVEYKDSLPAPSPAAHAAATKLCHNLNLIGAEELAPEASNSCKQVDGWSCGLWVCRWIERQIRENRGEARYPPPSLGECITRANEFITKLKDI